MRELIAGRAFWTYAAARYCYRQKQSSIEEHWIFVCFEAQGRKFPAIRQESVRLAEVMKEAAQS
jgi:hypothetical protein